jgi:hypothetical protein
VASISREELLRLARAGAVARLSDLRAELDAIYSAFPDLRSGGGGTRARAGRRSAAGNRTARSGAAKRAWSAADRKAVSDRMKKYWAMRRAKAGKSTK